MAEIIELAELLKQRQALNEKIEQLQANAKSEAIAKIQELINQFDLGQEDIFPVKTKAAKKELTVNKVEPKYRNPETGQEWSGRGLPPKWIAGKDREEFLIK